MRYALLADVHANLPALEAVLADLDGRAPDAAAYHLGDLVGYAPWPDEVVAVLRERGIHGVAGNYDSTVATDHPHCGCRYEDPRQEELSGRSYEWTRTRVSEETRRRLAALPFRLDLRPAGGHASGLRAILVHGAPTLNTLYWTADRSEDFCRKMAGIAGAREGDLIAFGHTHVPWEREVDGVRFVNAGSVGRPKDGDPRACYALVEFTGAGSDERRTAGGADSGCPGDGDGSPHGLTDPGALESSPSSEAGAGSSGGPPGPEPAGTRRAPSWEVEFVRVEYDLERAERAIRESDLPDEFAAYLRTGGTFPEAPSG